MPSGLTDNTILRNPQAGAGCWLLHLKSRGQIRSRRKSEELSFTPAGHLSQERLAVVTPPLLDVPTRPRPCSNTVCGQEKLVFPQEVISVLGEREIASFMAFFPCAAGSCRE